MQRPDQTARPTDRTARALADQLGQVRAEIRALKAREAELRDRALRLRPNGPVEGAEYTLELRHGTRRSLDTKALPPEIRQDPRFWREAATTTVRVTARRAAADAEDDLQLIEPF